MDCRRFLPDCVLTTLSAARAIGAMAPTGAAASPAAAAMFYINTGNDNVTLDTSSNSN